jgi:hypothetical protein
MKNENAIKLRTYLWAALCGIVIIALGAFWVALSASEIGFRYWSVLILPALAVAFLLRALPPRFSERAGRGRFGTTCAIVLYADCSGRLAMHCSGFSWIAALYPPLWAVPRRLWLACLGWLAISLSGKALLLAVLFHLPLLGAGVGGSIYLGAVLIERWVLGRFANSFHRWWLQRHGYVLIAAAPSAHGAAA